MDQQEEAKRVVMEKGHGDTAASIAGNQCEERAVEGMGVSGNAEIMEVDRAGDETSEVDEEDPWDDALLDRTQYAFVKRTPLRPPSRAHDMYITTSRQRSVLLKRAYRLLIDDRLPFIILHGLGAAIPIAVEVALQLMGELDIGFSSRPRPPTEDDLRRANEVENKSMSSALPVPPSVTALSPFTSSFFSLSITTGTEVVVDDYVPLVEGLMPVTHTRRKSSIHIKIAVKKEAADVVFPQRLGGLGGGLGGEEGRGGGGGRGRGGGGGRGGGDGGRVGGGQRGGGGGGRGRGGRGGGRGRGGGSEGGANHHRQTSEQPWKKQKR